MNIGKSLALSLRPLEEAPKLLELTDGAAALRIKSCSLAWILISLETSSSWVWGLTLLDVR